MSSMCLPACFHVYYRCSERFVVNSVVGLHFGLFYFSVLFMIVVAVPLPAVFEV